MFISIAYAAQKAHSGAQPNQGSGVSGDDGGDGGGPGPDIIDSTTLPNYFPDGTIPGTVSYASSSLETLFMIQDPCVDTIIALTEAIKSRIQHQIDLGAGHVAGYACPIGEWTSATAYQ